MVVAMAGRAAEQTRFGVISSGAANDLEQANRMAREGVERLGFSPRVGQIISAAGPYQVPLSAETRRAIDEEIRRMVDTAYEDAVALLEDHRDELDALATVLLEREQIDRGEIEGALAAVAGGGRRLPARADALPMRREAPVPVETAPEPAPPGPMTTAPRRRRLGLPVASGRRVRAGAEAAAATVFAMRLARRRRARDKRPGMAQGPTPGVTLRG
jgi:cell division protease FtsH